MAWDPDQYLKYGSQRLRPGLDLAQRIALTSPNVIYDLGAGAGGLTHLLHQRWPQSRIIGVDSSVEMLQQATRDYPEIEWQQADIRQWTPPEPPDLIYSNAALHWLDDHPQLFPRLLQYLNPGGVLAVQMPGNFAAPSHKLMRELAETSPWAQYAAGVAKAEPVMALGDYYDLLVSATDGLDLWETVYFQVMAGEDPVLEWVRGTALRPVLEALPPQEREGFEAAYRRRLRAAYPTRADGNTLFPFRRLFIVASKSQ